MNDNPIFYLQFSFILKGEGLTFCGYIKNNKDFEIGDYVEFDFESKKVRRKIRRVGLVNHKENFEKGLYTISLFITCKDKAEAESISKSELKDVECVIYKNK